MIIVAYSGGYAPAAWAAHHGGIGDRLRGIILLDALYAEMDKFADWIEHRGAPSSSAPIHAPPATRTRCCSAC